MAREALERTINGHTYSIGLHTPSKGIEIAGRLARMVGPGQAALGMMAGAGRADQEATASMIEGMARALVAGVDPTATASLIKDLLSACTVNGQPVPAVFEGHYVGEYAELVEAVQVTIEHNRFFDLFDLFLGVGLTPVEKSGTSPAPPA